jgi:hypothetical protein
MSQASETPVLDCRTEAGEFFLQLPLPRILRGSSLPPDGVGNSPSVTSLDSRE